MTGGSLTHFGTLPMGSVRSAVVPHKPRRTAIGGADPRGGLLGDELSSAVVRVILP